MLTKRIIWSYDYILGFFPSPSPTMLDCLCFRVAIIRCWCIVVHRNVDVLVEYLLLEIKRFLLHVLERFIYFSFVGSVSTLRSNLVRFLAKSICKSVWHNFQNFKWLILSIHVMREATWKCWFSVTQSLQHPQNVVNTACDKCFPFLLFLLYP